MFHKRFSLALLCIAGLALLMPPMPALNLARGGDEHSKSCGDGKKGGDDKDDDDDHGCGKSKDTTPPTITCPGNFGPKGSFPGLDCGQSTCPAATGYPTVTDDTDPHPKLTWSDSVESNLCGSRRVDRIITRTWRARDKAGNSSTCTQEIFVNKLDTPMDILPGDCSNLFVLDGDPLPITLLGTDEIPAGQIRPGSVHAYLLGNCDLAGVRPRSLYFGDVATVGECQASADGRSDLTFFFNKAQLADAFGLAAMPSGTVVNLVLSGELCSGCEFIATSKMIIQ